MNVLGGLLVKVVKDIWVQRLLAVNRCQQAQVDGDAVLGLRDRLRTGLALKSFLGLHCPVSKIELQITRIKRPIKH